MKQSTEENLKKIFDKYKNRNLTKSEAANKGKKYTSNLETIPEETTEEVSESDEKQVRKNLKVSRLAEAPKKENKLTKYFAKRKEAKQAKKEERKKREDLYKMGM